MINLVTPDASHPHIEFARLGDASFTLTKTVSEEGLDTFFVVASHGEKSFTFPVDDNVGKAIEECGSSMVSQTSPESIEDKTGVEIERKFALSGVSLDAFSEIFNNHVSNSKELVQVYVETGKDKGGYELRVRKDGEDFKMTMKVGKGQERIEIEAEIPESLFNSLLAIRGADRKCGVAIEKTRYTFGIDGWEYSLDVYKGANEGLFVVEIEFDSNTDANSFELPDVLKSLGFVDVTDVDRYKNRYLATNPFNKW